MRRNLFMSMKKRGGLALCVPSRSKGVIFIMGSLWFIDVLLVVYPAFEETLETQREHVNFQREGLSFVDVLLVSYTIVEGLFL